MKRFLSGVDIEKGPIFARDITNNPGDIVTLDPVTNQMFKRTLNQVLIDLNAVVPIYKHTQAVASLTWVVTHNLNFMNPIVTVYDNDNKILIPLQVVSNNNNVVTITFSQAVSGYATIAGGSMAVITEQQSIVNALIFG